MRNISATGAMIEAPEPVRVGTRLLLELSQTISISAIVERTVGNQLGVSFPSPFDVTLLVQARATGSHPTWAPPAYLDSALQAAWERRLRRLSPAQLRAELEVFMRR